MKNFYLMGLGFALVFSFSANANVSSGNPVEVNTEEMDTLIQESESVAPAEIAAPEPRDVSYSVNRPWLLRNAGNPTAFVLDSNDFQIDFALAGPAESFPNIDQQKVFGLAYGVSDSIMIGSSLSVSPEGLDFVGISPRLNFANTSSMSFALEVNFANVQGVSESYLQYGAQLIGSEVISDRFRLHANLGGSRSNQTFGMTSFQFLGGAEWRPGRSHLVGASLGPRLFLFDFFGDSVFGTETRAEYRFILDRFAIGLTAGLLQFFEPFATSQLQTSIQGSFRI